MSNAVSWQLSLVNGRSFVRSFSDGERCYLVNVVNAASGAREPIGEFASHEEANSLADWFGRDGQLYAEVVAP